MAYPEIKQEEIEELQKCVGQEVTLMEWTAGYIDQFRAPQGEAALRDDWEEYGGYPGYVPESSREIKIALIAILGKREGEKIFPEYIIGREGGSLRIYPHRTWAVSWITSVHNHGKILWSPGRGSLDEQQQDIKDVYLPELVLLRKNLEQIVP